MNNEFPPLHITQHMRQFYLAYQEKSYTLFIQLQPNKKSLTLFGVMCLR